MGTTETQEDALSFIRKETLDIYNRLHSIEEDIAFVKQVHDVYLDTPLLPNLRCGAWYTDPDTATSLPAYFKSTDGHFNNWSFNLRRPNIHLLHLLAEKTAMILVDSTRSGKRMPDALSKTVPIWCAVVNRALLARYPELKEHEHFMWDTGLYTPPSAVSIQEHHQIERRLDIWAEALAKSSFTLPILSRPLRPVWITPATTTFPELPTKPGELGSFLPIICVSASKKVDEGFERRFGGYSYVQGSGDDHELWGMGLTPTLFWKYRQDLLHANRSDLPGFVASIVFQESTLPTPKTGTTSRPTPIAKVGDRLLLCSVADLANMSTDSKKTVRYLILTSSESDVAQETRSKRTIHVISGKKGQTHFLAHVLPECMDFIGEELYDGHDIVVACDTGKDLSVGAVLAALQLFFCNDGSLKTPGAPADLTNKSTIRTRLEWIIASRSQANPSRATLKRVNEFLLTPPSFLPQPSTNS